MDEIYEEYYYFEQDYYYIDYDSCDEENNFGMDYDDTYYYSD